MFASSLMIIVRKHSEYAVMGLIGVVVTQALGYGLIFDLNFFLRNLSVMGGLLMVLSDSWVRKKFAPAGLPQLSRVQLVEQNKNSTVSGTAFKRPIEDFFFTDPISRSSPTMARCSAAKAQKIAKTNFMAPGEPEAQVAYGV